MKSFLVGTVLVLTVVVAGFSQFYMEHSYSNRVFIQDVQYLPSGKFLKGAALCFDEVLADLIWIKAIGYFGDHARTDKDFKWLYQLIDVTTALDPYFEDPYEFGGIILGTEINDIEGSLAILKKGMTNVPKHHQRYWYLPFFTAFNYMYYKGDYKTAAHYLEIASSFPQRPPYLPLLVARLYANTDDPDVAIPFLVKMLERSSAETREKLEQRIKEIKLLKHLKELTVALYNFKKAKGKYPQSIEELVRDGYLIEIPKEPFGGRYFISRQDHSIQTTSKEVDKMELHIEKPQ